MAGRGSAVAVAGTLAVLLTGLALGALTLRAQHHYSALRESGAALNGMARLLADGPSPLTAWPGWLAAACFGLAVRRLGQGALEPPIGRGGVTASVARLRASLRAELRAVRAALWVVSALALLDGGRLVWFAAAALHDGIARQSLAALATEAAGLAVAALALRGWVRHFAAQLELLGAL